MIIYSMGEQMKYNISKAANREAYEAYEALPEGSNMNTYSEASVKYNNSCQEMSFNGARFMLPYEYSRVTDKDTETSTWFENGVTNDCIYMDILDMGTNEKKLDPRELERSYEEFFKSNFTLEGSAPKEISYNNNTFKYYNMTDVLEDGQTINCYGCYTINRKKAVLIVYYYTRRPNNIFIDFLSSLMI